MPPTITNDDLAAAPTDVVEKMQREVERQIAKQIRQRLKGLSKDQVTEFTKLITLFQTSASRREEGRVFAAIRELIWPDGLTKRANAEAGVTEEARQKLAAYRKRVGAAIRARRVELRMTQQELAKAAAMPQSHVSRLETGEHAATALTIAKLADALKTKPSALDPGFE